MFRLPCKAVRQRVHICFVFQLLVVCVCWHEILQVHQPENKQYYMFRYQSVFVFHHSLKATN